MVDRLIRPLKTHFGLVFSSFNLPGRPLYPVALHSFCSQLHEACAGYLEYPFEIKHKICRFKFSREVYFLFSP